MKAVRWLAVGLAVLGIVFAVGALTVFAADPVNNSPATAFYIDNQPHTLDANSSGWYRFEYGGGNSLVTATLVQGANSGFRFDVFTPEQALDLTDEKPIGRGTVLAVNCNSGLPAPGGGCQGNDLVWTGKFPASGIYYVHVFNDNTVAAPFTLTIAGDNVTQCTPANSPQASQPGVTLCQPAQTATNMPGTTTPANAIAAPTKQATGVPAAQPSGTATAVPAKQPTAAPTGTQNNNAQACAPANANAQCVSQPNTFYTDPYHALPISNTQQTIPGNAAIWYRFEYAGDNSDITLRLLNGALNGLQFRVFTPDQAATWYNETAIGKGTATPCTYSSDTSNCGQNVNDLLWQGKFPIRGTYFVQVQNPNPNPVQFTLTVDGGGVALCGANAGANNAPLFVATTDTQNQFLLPCPAATNQ